MGCTKLRSSDGTVIGFLCSSIQESGNFLIWKWELHKNLGVCWWVKYPTVECRGLKRYFKRRREYFKFWCVIREILLYNPLYWFSIKENEILLGNHNPLWLWYFFQRWYRKKLEK